MDPRLVVGQVRQHVEVGLRELVELPPALDLRDDLVLVPDGLQHAGVGREAGLAAPLARQAELLEEDRAELLRRAEHELLARELPDLALERADLGMHAVADRGQPRLCVEPHAGDAPSSRRTSTSGSSISSMRRCRPRSASCSRCHCASVAHRTACAPAASSTVVPNPRSSHSSAKRVPAAGRLEQVGREHRVVGQVRRHDAELLRVVRDDRSSRPSAPTRSSGRGHGPTSTSSPHGDAEAPARPPWRTARPPRPRARRRPMATSVSCGEPRGRRRASPPRTLRRPAPRRQTGRPSRPVPCAAPSTSSRRLSGSPQLELAEDLAAAATAVGLAGQVGVRVDVDRDRRGASSRAARRSARRRRGWSGSPCAWHREISSMEASTVSEVAELLQQRRGGLVADARDAGDVVRRVALQAVEVGDRARVGCRSGR